MERRTFLKGFAAVLAGGATAPSRAVPAMEAAIPEGYAMLIDTTTCVGCRKCEWACAQQNGLSDAPMEFFEDTQVFEKMRRMDENAFTVVNQFAPASEAEDPIFVKQQCMHCLRPACVSACLVGALERQPDGAVAYDANKCIGCRYCMVACPFEVPAYEFSDPLTPRVRKCSLCASRLESEGKIPACAEICPPMAISFGKRAEILALAHEKIAQEPDTYIEHVYGEHEVGGTSVLYLAGMPFTALGFPELGTKPIPELTETIQHSVFKYGIPPLLAIGLLGAVMRSFGEEDREEEAAALARGHDGKEDAS